MPAAASSPFWIPRGEFAIDVLLRSQSCAGSLESKNVWLHIIALWTGARVTLLSRSNAYFLVSMN